MSFRCHSLFARPPLNIHPIQSLHVHSKKITKYNNPSPMCIPSAEAVDGVILFYNANARLHSTNMTMLGARCRQARYRSFSMLEMSASLSQRHGTTSDALWWCVGLISIVSSQLPELIDVCQLVEIDGTDRKGPSRTRPSAEVHGKRNGMLYLVMLL